MLYPHRQAPVQSTFLAPFRADFDALGNRFQVGTLDHEGEWPTESLFREQHALSVVDDAAKKRRWLLLPASATPNVALSWQMIPLNRVPEWALRELLMKGLPAVLGRYGDTTRFEADGLHYLVERRQFGGRWDIITTIRLALMRQAGTNRWHLTPQVTYFTPRTMHANTDGTIPRHIRKLERYNLDRFGRTLRRDPEGVFICRPPNAPCRNSVPAVDAKEPVERTLWGAITTFLADFERAYGQPMILAYDQLIPDPIMSSEAEMPKLLWFITTAQPDGETKREVADDHPWPMYCGRLENGEVSIELMDHKAQALLKSKLTKRQAGLVFRERKRSDVIFCPHTGDTLIITDTGAVILPDNPSLERAAIPQDALAECYDNGEVAEAWWQQATGLFAARAADTKVRQGEFSRIFMAESNAGPIPDWFWQQLVVLPVNHGQHWVGPEPLHRTRLHATQRSKEA